MKREEAIANAMAVLAFAESKQIGHIRAFHDYEAEVEINIHFKKMGNEAHISKKDILPLLMGGTIIEEYLYPNRSYDCLGIIWRIVD